MNEVEKMRSGQLADMFTIGAHTLIGPCVLIYTPHHRWIMWSGVNRKNMLIR